MTSNGNPKPIHIVLSKPEMMMAGYVGLQRNIGNIKAGRKHRHGMKNDFAWQAHIEGAMAEYVVAKSLGIFWHGDVGKVGAPDVSSMVEVRTTAKRSNRLIIHPDDHDDRAYVLVAGEMGEYWIQGWTLGKHAKLDQYWGDPSGKGRPAFWVPTEDLMDLDNLRILLSA